MSKMIYQNENAVLNHLGVRKLVKVEYTLRTKGEVLGTPAEIEELKKQLKIAGATNIKVK